MTSSSALLAVAHGSTDPRAESVLDALIARVRAERPDLAATLCYLGHSTPDVTDAVNDLVEQGFSRVIVVPLLLTSAFHARFDLPGVIEQSRVAHPSVEFRQAEVLGPHPQLFSLIYRRLNEADVHDTASLVLGAIGTSDPRANAELADVAATMGATIGFASCAPHIADVVADVRAAGARQIAIISYVLAPGTLPDRFYAAGADVITDVLGAAPELVNVILERYDAAVGASVS